MAVRSIEIHPGQTIILPRDAVITSLLLDGDISVSSTCDNLPEPTAYQCGIFFIWVDCDDNSGHSMDEQSTYYTSVTVGGNTYVINELIVIGENCGTATPVATLNLHVTDQAMFTFVSVSQSDLTKKTGITLHCKVPEALFSTTELLVDNGGSPQIYRLQEEECA